MKPETVFRSRKVLPFLKTLKKCHIFSIQQSGKHGDPDFILCLNGYFVALELKSKAGKVRPLQAKILSSVATAQGFAIVTSPDTFEDDKRILKYLEKTNG